MCYCSDFFTSRCSLEGKRNKLRIAGFSCDLWIQEDHQGPPPISAPPLVVGCENVELKIETENDDVASSSCTY